MTNPENSTENNKIWVQRLEEKIPLCSFGKPAGWILKFYESTKPDYVTLKGYQELHEIISNLLPGVPVSVVRDSTTGKIVDIIPQKNDEGASEQ